MSYSAAMCGSFLRHSPRWDFQSLPHCDKRIRSRKLQLDELWLRALSSISALSDAKKVAFNVAAYVSLKVPDRATLPDFPRELQRQSTHTARCNYTFIKIYDYAPHLFSLLPLPFVHQLRHDFRQTQRNIALWLVIKNISEATHHPHNVWCVKNALFAICLN